VKSVMLHTAAPWEPTGYGTQCAYLATWLAARGHQVTISARSGIVYNTGDFDGIPVLTGPPFLGDTFADDLLPAHVDAVRPDVVVILYDLWNLSLPADRLPAGPRIFAWQPVDCTPLDFAESAYLKVGNLTPIAMSEFGRAQFQAAGIGCEYIPHMIPTGAFCPMEDPGLARDAFRIPRDAFVIGINASVTDERRKGIFEQLAAFAQFRGKHPKAVLMFHGLPNFAFGLDVLAVMRALGIPIDAARFPNPYPYLTGQLPQPYMHAWYACLDFLSNCTYGEGFGLAALEAQACGVPVVLSDGSTGPQLAGPGLLVPTQANWNAKHQAMWHAPLIGHHCTRCGQVDGITGAWEKAYKRLRDADSAETWRAGSREFALQYDIEQVGPMWDKLLAGVKTRG
jgi:glycosyltransferase involved in cell wall biosynthesis